MATQPAPAGSSERVGPLLGRYVALLRPHQWVKNLAIFPPVVFSFGLFDPTILAAAGLGFVSLCLTSSSVYALNDVCDAESDARHPRKRLRPVAAGAIPKGLALALSAALALVGLAVAYSVNWWLAIVVAIYWSTILLYSLALKRVALLDVMTIGIGFVLRVIAGAVVSLTPPSNWLLLVALFLALLLALGKRRQELQVQSHIAGTSRPVLRDYDLQMVNQVLAVLAGLVIMSYSLFTVSEYAQAPLSVRLPDLHGSLCHLRGLPLPAPDVPGRVGRRPVTALPERPAAADRGRALDHRQRSGHPLAGAVAAGIARRLW